MERCAYNIALEECLIHLSLMKEKSRSRAVKAIVGFG